MRVCMLCVCVCVVLGMICPPKVSRYLDHLEVWFPVIIPRYEQEWKVIERAWVLSNVGKRVSSQAIIWL